MKRLIFMFIGLITMALLVSCSATDEKNATEATDVQDIKQLVNDYSVGNIEGQSASITSHQLIVTNSDKSQLVYELPEDDFFVSIAPYISQTHP